MNKALKLLLAFILAMTISAGFVIAHNYDDITNSVKSWIYCTGAEETGFLNDGMKKAMLIARDELRDTSNSMDNSNQN